MLVCSDLSIAYWRTCLPVMRCYRQLGCIAQLHQQHCVYSNNQHVCTADRGAFLTMHARTHARTRTAPVIIRKTRLSVMVIAMYALTKTSTAIGAQKTNSGNIDNNLISMIITCINHNPSDPPSKFPIHLSTDGTAESHTHTPNCARAFHCTKYPITRSHPSTTRTKSREHPSKTRALAFHATTQGIPQRNISPHNCAGAHPKPRKMPRHEHTHTHDKRDPSPRRWFAPTRPDTRTRASHASLRMRARAYTIKVTLNLNTSVHVCAHASQCSLTVRSHTFHALALFIHQRSIQLQHTHIGFRWSFCALCQKHTAHEHRMRALTPIRTVARVPLDERFKSLIPATKREGSTKC